MLFQHADMIAWNRPADKLTCNNQWYRVLYRCAVWEVFGTESLTVYLGMQGPALPVKTLDVVSKNKEIFSQKTNLETRTKIWPGMAKWWLYSKSPFWVNSAESQSILWMIIYPNRSWVFSHFGILTSDWHQFHTTRKVNKMTFSVVEKSQILKLGRESHYAIPWRNK